MDTYTALLICACGLTLVAVSPGLPAGSLRHIVMSEPVLSPGGSVLVEVRP